MKKCSLLLVVALLIITSISLIACNDTDNTQTSYKVSFVVDGQPYFSISTKGGEEIIMPANPTKDKYVFDGWYRDNGVWNQPFTAKSFLYEKPTSDITVYAKWVEIVVKVEYTVSFNSMGGSAVGKQTVESGGLVTRPSNPTKDKMIFEGWYKESSCINEWNFATDRVQRNMSLYAKWSEDLTQKEYTVVFNSMGGTDVNNQVVKSGSLVDEPDEPTKDKMIFEGWYKESNCINEWNFATDRVQNDTTLYAKWEEDLSQKEYAVSFDSNGGSSVEEQLLKIGDLVIEPETPTKVGMVFVGWYKESSFINKWNFENDTVQGVITLYAKWSEMSYIREENVIYFGTYPQTLVTNSVITSVLETKMGELPTSTDSGSWTSYKYYISKSNATDFMWYKDIVFNGVKYRGVYFTQYRPYETTRASGDKNSRQDDNGFSLSTVYWFKFEPIKWRILEENNGKAYLLSDLVIDAQEYYSALSANYNVLYHNGGTGYPNNYALSNIRIWLNNNFYNTAFSNLQKELIEVTEVDNGTWSTGYSNNMYACENTNDKVFLLSEREVTSVYFKNTSERGMYGTDYAKIQGCYQNTSPKTYGQCGWMLRSPSCNDKLCNYGRGIHTGDNVTSHFGVSDVSGLVPVLWIHL